jgi:hypothetical protein
LAIDAKSAYVHALTSAVWVSVAASLAGALVALIWLPARAGSQAVEPAGADAADVPSNGSEPTFQPQMLASGTDTP